jgi:malate dehydrogenase
MTMFARQFTSSASSHAALPARKVAVLGAAGGIGQPLSLLLKLNPNLSDLALYDIANIGMATDLAHISTGVKVTGHSGESELPNALKGAQVVLIPAGVPRKPGMTRDDLFNINASIVRNLSKACAQHCPSAHVMVISNPVNSTVPIAFETMKAAGVSKPSVFGVTTLDTTRAKTFIGQLKGVAPEQVSVTVIGGHSGTTIIPLLSTSGYTFSEEERAKLVRRIQYGGDEVVEAKAGGGSATLSMAFAAVSFFNDFCKGLEGKELVKLVAYVRTPGFETDYFATELSINGQGLSAIHSLPKLDAHDQALYSKAIEPLKAEIKKGVEFAAAGVLKQ